ncbi:MAG: hypothetical protein EZS28_027307 [Streblomastix strix]|uniref:Uncharacterized protein n=1 Tax=Streblomastix strix TaxID=222440 RepID=A0A5J4V2J2_9EUKA|nr:MAG: hypothetical protein EZS28_027307 [Streblomastix strix]
MNIKMNINVEGEDKKKQQIIPCIGSALGISLFGGRVITVSIPQLTKADESIKSVIEIRNVVNQEENKVEEGLDIYQQIYQLEESLNKDQLIEYCLKKSQNNEIQEEQQNESQQSKTIWKILAHILIGKQKGRSIRKELLQLLGMDVSKLQTIGEKKEKIQLRKKKRQQRREEEQKKKEEEQRKKIEEEKRIKEEEERKKKELDNLRQKAFQLQSDDDDASSFFDREEQLNKEQKTDKLLNEQINKEEQKDENKEKEESSSKEKQSKSKQVIKEHWQKAAIQYKKDQNKKQLNKEIENLLITGDIKGASILCLSSGLDILALQLADLVWNNDQDDKLNRKNRKKGQQKKEEEEQDELTFRDKIRIAVRKKAKQEWRFMELLEKIELQNDVGKDKRTDIEGEEEGNQLKPLIYEESLKNERLWIEKEEGKQNKKKNKGKKQKEEEEEEDDDDLESDSDEQEEKDNKLIIEQDIDIQNPLDDLEQEEQEEESKFSSFGWRKELSVILTYCCDDDLIDEITFMIESEEEKKKQELNEQNNKKSDINDDEIIDEYNDTYLLLLHLLAGNIQQAFKLWNGFDKQTTQSSSSEQNIQKQQLKRLERQLILLNVYPYEIYEREKIKIIEPLIWQVGQYSNQLLEQGNIIESKKFIESVLNILNGVQILEQDQEVNLTKVLISLLVKLRNRIHQSFFTERKEIDSIAQQELKITLSREEQILIQGRKKQNEIEEKKKRQNRERIEQQRKKELIEEEQRKKIEKEKKIKIERDQFEQEEQIKRQNVKKIEHIEQQQEYKSSITPPAPLSLSQQAPQLRAKDTNPYPNQQDILPPPLNLSTNQQQGRIQQQQQQQQQQPQYHGPKKSNIGGGRDALIQIEPQSQHTKSIAMMNAAPPKNTQQSQQSDNSNINHGQTEFVDRKEDKRIEQQGQKDANERQVGSGTTEKLNQQADQQQQKQLLLGQVSTVKFINTLTKMQKFSEEMELEDESMRPVAVGLSQLIQTITPQQFTETNHLGQLKDIRDRILELIKRMASGQGDKALSSEHKDLLKKVVELSLQGSFDEATHVQRQIVAEHWEQASGYVTHLKKLITELQKRVLPH